MEKYRHIHFNERGSLVNIVLLVLLALSLTGVLAMSLTRTELRISRNLFTEKKSFQAAQSGLAEAKLRLRGLSTGAHYAGDPAGSPNPLWSSYISTSESWTIADDPEYNGAYTNYFPVPGGSKTSTTITENSIQPSASYFVKIRHKREYDAEQAGHTTSSTHYYDGDGTLSVHSAASPGNIVYYGYGDPGSPSAIVQFTTGGGTSHRPVEIVAAYGDSGNSESVLRIEVAHPPGPKIVAALYAKGDITGNGSSLEVDGTDECGSAPAVPPMYTLNPSVTDLNGNPTLDGDPPVPVSGTEDIDIAGHVSSMKESATATITSDQNGNTFGDPSDFITLYSDTSNPYNVGGLKLQNVTGYGTLVIEGDLTMGGGFEWNGVILVTGTLTFNGGGSGINIRGAVLAEQTIDLNGGIDVGYDSCMIESAMNNLPVKVLAWYEVQ